MINRNENSGFRVRRWLTQSSGGVAFGDVLLPAGAALRRIYIHSADLVDGLQCEYETGHGVCGLTRCAGGVGGWRHAFDIPKGEKLRAVSGSFGRFLNSIRFHTVEGHSFEYGMTRGERFFLEIGEGQRFRGIFGREGAYLDSLGIVLENVAPEPAAAEFVVRMRGAGYRTYGDNGGILVGAAGGERKAA